MLGIPFCLSAELSNGFYRVQNSESQRYLYVIDNKGYAKLEGSQVKTDLDAIYLRADLNNAISDPASIIYVEKHDSKYDFCAQGTSVHDIISYYVSLPENRNEPGTYRVGASVSGASAYLIDRKYSSKTGYGAIATATEKDNGGKFWRPIAVDSSSDNFFGVKPTVSSEDKHYASFYADFGFTPNSEGTKAYYVSEYSEKAVLLTEVSGIVSANTPVIIECASVEPVNNKLDLTTAKGANINNMLSGVYFNTNNEKATYAAKVHKNQTAVNGLMRVLSVNKQGKLVFATSTEKFLAANSAYLKVSSSSVAKELPVFFSKEEYDKYNNGGTIPVDPAPVDPTPVDPTPVDPAPVDPAPVDPTPVDPAPVDPGNDPSSLDNVRNKYQGKKVYNLLGKRIENTENLPAGIYIIDGKKTVIRN